jgi:acetyl-CoA carboxylase carboxyl transferase subunit alpha
MSPQHESGARAAASRPVNTQVLDFERQAQRFETEVGQLSQGQASQRIDLGGEIADLRAKVEAHWRKSYEGLSPWQVVQVARHPRRPYTLDYIDALFVDFVELHGDRLGADDAAIVGGLAHFEGQPLVVIGHQKGRCVKERALRNFGMPRPEGYRKAVRLMHLAERFALPLITFIDTPGAFPGIEAEERGQSAAIGESLYAMSQLSVPSVAVVIGEGGSGGALAIGVADTVCMLQYATFSVISPEGCAAILWKDTAAAEQAAAALTLTAQGLHAIGLVDLVIEEPTGGAHRDPAKAAEYVGRALRAVLARLALIDPQQRLSQRHARLRSCGALAEPLP